MEIKISSIIIIIIIISILYYYFINLISKNKYKFYSNIIYFICNFIFWILIYYTWILIILDWENIDYMFKYKYINLYILQFSIIVLLPIILSIIKNYFILKKFNIRESIIKNILLDILKIYSLWIIILLIFILIINI